MSRFFGKDEKSGRKEKGWTGGPAVMGGGGARDVFPLERLWFEGCFPRALTHFWVCFRRENIIFYYFSYYKSDFFTKKFVGSEICRTFVDYSSVKCLIVC